VRAKRPVFLVSGPRSALACLSIEGLGGAGARPSHQVGVIVKQFTFEYCEQT
jgi:hypothetical protein